jgi:hypothetical protein
MLLPEPRLLSGAAAMVSGEPPDDIDGDLDLVNVYSNYVAVANNLMFD